MWEVNINDIEQHITLSNQNYVIYFGIFEIIIKPSRNVKNVNKLIVVHLKRISQLYLHYFISLQILLTYIKLWLYKNYISIRILSTQLIYNELS